MASKGSVAGKAAISSNALNRGGSGTGATRPASPGGGSARSQAVQSALAKAKAFAPGSAERKAAMKGVRKVETVGETMARRVAAGKSPLRPGQRRRVRARGPVDKAKRAAYMREWRARHRG